MRRARGCFDLLADLSPGAVALVDETRCSQPFDLGSIELEPLALTKDSTIPVDPDRGEVGELPVLVFDRRGHQVEIFHANHELSARRPSRQPGDERRSKIADVQFAGGRGCETAGHRAILVAVVGRRDSARQLNRRERMTIILERDGAECVWCRRPLEVRLVEATTEHLVPRIKGGPSWMENELAACRRCNGERGHRTPGDWFDECERRGWEPNRATIVGALHALSGAISRRGGQRRARPYIASQLRRLDPDA